MGAPAASGTATVRAGSVGLYRPRRPRASPLYRLLEDHFAEFSTVYDERFAHRYGYWRPVIAEVVEKYLACGILEHGFARVRCGACKPRVSARVLVQVPLLLPELPREASGALGSVAGGDPARGRTTPAGGARGTKAAQAVLALQPRPPWRPLAGCRAHHHGVHPHDRG